MGKISPYIVGIYGLGVHPIVPGYGRKNGLQVTTRGTYMDLVLRFTGMLAFAPMPCVPASLHDMAKMRVGTGQLGAQETKPKKKHCDIDDT